MVHHCSSQYFQKEKTTGYTSTLQRQALDWIAMNIQQFTAEHQPIQNGFRVQCIILILLLIHNCSFIHIKIRKTISNFFVTFLSYFEVILNGARGRGYNNLQMPQNC